MPTLFAFLFLMCIISVQQFGSTKHHKGVRLTPTEALSFVKLYRAYYCSGDFLWTTNVAEEIYDENPALWVLKSFYQRSVSYMEFCLVQHYCFDKKGLVRPCLTASVISIIGQ